MWAPADLQHDRRRDLRGRAERLERLLDEARPDVPELHVGPRELVDDRERALGDRGLGDLGPRPRRRLRRPLSSNFFSYDST